MMSKYLRSIARLDGPNLRLRLVQAEDSEYIYTLRMCKTLNQYLSHVSGTADDQIEWINRYKERERASEEFYYVIERCDNANCCGLVRLYELREDSFTWGSWILDQNKPAKAALESAVLIYELGFGLLNRSKATFDVRRDNIRTISFHQRFGATQTHTDDMDAHFIYPRKRFQQDRASHYRVLESVSL
jgi:hypothetical protein